MAGSANGGRVAGAESQEMQSVSANRVGCSHFEVEKWREDGQFGQVI